MSTQSTEVPSVLSEQSTLLTEKKSEKRKRSSNEDLVKVETASPLKEDEEVLEEVNEEVTVSDADFVPEEGNSSACALALGILCFPLTLCGSCFCVNEKEEAIILSFGKYSTTVRDPGIHFSNCWGREIITISKAKLSTEIPTTKVIDKDGNPVMVSGVVFYHFRDTKKAAIDILDRATFVSDQAAAVLKQIVSHYPYDVHDIDSDDDESDEEVPCLKRDTEVIVTHLVSELQKRVNISGAKIDSFRFNEISFAPEIAASLLKKQQAAAIVASRHTLVEGAVKIATTAVAKLDKKGISVDPADRARLVSNLLTVVCADEHVQPVILLGST